MSTIAKALAHPARLQLLRTLANQSECRGAELFGDLPLAQSTVSQHLSVLKDAGLVRSHPAGQGSTYCLAPESLRAFAEEITALVADAPSCGDPQTPVPPAKECR